MSTPTEPTISASGIADLAAKGNRSTVSNWRRRYPDFPQPVAGSAASPLFNLAEVQAWLRQHGRSTQPVNPARSLAGVLTQWQDRVPAESRSEVAASMITLRHLASAAGAGHGPSWRDVINTPAEAQPSTVSAAVAELYHRDPNLTGVLDPLLDAPGALTAGLMRALDGIAPVNDAALIDDLTGLLQRSAAKAAAEHSTAHQLADLLVEAAVPITGTVLDPAAGTGSLLLAAANAAEGDVRLLGQEIDRWAWRLARQRFLVRDLQVDLQCGDSIRHDAFEDTKADVVLLEPPVWPKWDNPQDGFDPRWQFGMPGRHSPMWAWVQHAIWHLAPGGRACVLLPLAASTQGGKDAAIRSELVRRGSLEAVVALPAGVAEQYSGEMSLWVLTPPAEAPRERILLLDASTQTLQARPLGQALAAWHREQRTPDHHKHVAVPVLDLLAPDATLNPVAQVPPELPGGVTDPLRHLQEHAATLSRYRRQLSELPELDFANLRAGTAGTDTVTVGQLLDQGQLALYRGSKVDRDHLGDEGEPVVTAAAVRDPLARLHSHKVPPEAVAGKLTRTEPGDVLVVAEGSKIAARVDPDGGALVVAPVQVLRLGRSWLLREYLAAALTNPLNHRFMTGMGIPRANIKDLEIRLLPPEAQHIVVEHVRQLGMLSILGRGIADIADTVAEMLIASTGIGAVTPYTDDDPEDAR